MDIRLFLSSMPSKAVIAPMVDKLMEDTSLQKQFWDEALCAEQPSAWRASWILDHLTDKLPEIILPYLVTLYSSLPTLINDGSKRHFLKMIGKCEPDFDKIGEHLDLFFGWMTSPNEAVCTKIFSLHLILKLVDREPYLAQEVLAYVETCLERGGTPGWMNSLKKCRLRLHEIQP